MVQHLLREQRLLVAEGFPDEDQGRDGLPPRVQPEGVQGIQRLLGGLVERQVEQKAAVVFPAALVGELVVGAVPVQTVEAVVQRQVGAELRQPAGAVLAAAGVFAPGEQKDDAAQRSRQQNDGDPQNSWVPPSGNFEPSFPYCNTTCGKLCYNI